MKRFLLSLGLIAGLAFPACAQEKDEGGISSPLLSRCAGKFGAELRAGDEAFPGFTLLGMPWFNVENTDQTVNGAHVVAIITGLGARSRRRGQIVAFRYRCLVDDKGAAVSFDETNLLPTQNEALPPGMVVRGVAYYRPKKQLPRGSELRVQLFDHTGVAPVLVTEAVVRSSWVDPIPFGLRIPGEAKLEGRKLAVDARVSQGSTTLYRLKAPHPLPPDRLQQPIDLVVEAVAAK